MNCQENLLALSIGRAVLLYHLWRGLNAIRPSYLIDLAGVMLEILVPVSLGELVDKITILRIKRARISGSSLRNVQEELSALECVMDRLSIDLDGRLMECLAIVNEQLWEIEDAVREKERIGLFDAEFVQLARGVYRKNDERARVKRIINERYGSVIVEEKSYGAHRCDA